MRKGKKNELLFSVKPQIGYIEIKTEDTKLVIIN